MKLSSHRTPIPPPSDNTEKHTTTANKRAVTGEMLRFVMVGILATSLHYLVYLLARVLMGDNLAYTLGYVLSFVANFYLTSVFTFRTSPTLERLMGMMGAHLVNYLLQIGLLNLFLGLGVVPWLAPVPVYCIAVPVNFVLVRFVFKHLNLKKLFHRK